MTQITITFDEKFDLEEGELRISRIDDIDNTYNFYWWENVDEDYTLISDFNIDFVLSSNFMNSFSKKDREEYKL